MKHFTNASPIVALMACIVCVILWWKLHEANERIVQLQSQESKEEAIPAQPVRPTYPAGDHIEMNPHVPVLQHEAEGATYPIEASAPVDTRLRADNSQHLEALRASTRLSLMDRYHDLAGEMNLRPEEARMVLEILTETRNLSLRRASADAGSEQERLAALLGAERYEKWREYEGNLPFRKNVEQIQAALSSSGQEPLSVEQKRFLVATMAAEKSRPNAELARVAATLDTSDPGSVRTFREAQLRIEMEGVRQISAQAASLLTREQLAALEDVLTEPSRAHLIKRSLQQDQQ